MGRRAWDAAVCLVPVLIRHQDLVIDLGDPRGRPGGGHGLVVLGPRAHRAHKGHPSGGRGIDGKVVPIELGVAPECLTYGLLDAAWARRGRQPDVVVERVDARDAGRKELGFVASQSGFGKLTPTAVGIRLSSISA